MTNNYNQAENPWGNNRFEEPQGKYGVHNHENQNPWQGDKIDNPFLENPWQENHFDNAYTETFTNPDPQNEQDSGWEL